MGIEPELCSLQYLRLDQVIQQIVKLGRGTQLPKIGIESGYQMIPVHPGDTPSLGIQWAVGTFFNTRLPFGLRSVPKIFSAIADTLQWSFSKHEVTWADHYLVDFITLGPPGTLICKASLKTIFQSCERLGIPLEPSKCARPATVLVFLGFELNTEQIIIRLPHEKLLHTLPLVRDWMGKKGCRKKDL